ncbi:carboxypeptidase regulatory-like domain-containing protein [Marivirga harenae]|uniref:carboxypeptidase regulatory-like domain-containing protein n=1 Tax=Marivirga harenae TaxID=2010992 RepID=UPI0026DF2D0B|nr:carboxypeptidase regulatory-like domain-containing protein [Marivirga harenae]WKV12459.1 carboxypeptidase regulatory-like domain-containing protein [Marivirga harenae]|tara:strand:+ start:73358 stop:73732 length:375 start_codon:yes stop_codon:yes gene_type:complete
MKKLTFTLSLLVVSAFLFFQFTPKNDNSQFLKTNLRIVIQDDLGNIQEGATVTLYGNNDDYRKSENPVAESQVTDKKGRVTFKDLEPKVYHIHAEKGKMNNNNLGVQTDTLEGGKLNKVAIVIQ